MSYVVLVVLLFLFSQDVWSLMLNKFSVPDVVMRGESAWLNCSYDIENDTLYSIKWFKDNVEFYSYLPADTGSSGHKYDVTGIHLDLSRSTEGNVFLNKTDVQSEGIYRCEVLTEDLSQTLKREKEMRIYVNPSSPPQTCVTKMQYLIGEIVNATCIAAPSRPAAILKWWINENEARKQLLYGPKIHEFPDGLFTSELLLSFKITSNHVRNGRMRLVCEATILQPDKFHSKEILISDKVPLKPTFSEYYSQKDSSRKTGVKRITGLYTGDSIDLECTSVKSQPATKLRWYINDKEAKAEYLIPQNPIHYDEGMVSTVLGLQFEIQHHHYMQTGEMRLRCTATLSDVMHMKSDPLEAAVSKRNMVDWLGDTNEGSAIYFERKYMLQILILMLLSCIFL